MNEIEYIKDFLSIKEIFKNLLGESKGESFFDNFIVPIIQLKIKTTQIELDIEDYEKLFINVLIPQTEDFYKNIYESNRPKNKSENEKKYFIRIKLEEIILLAYVGLYHKIENYEKNILSLYNKLAETNHKDLNKIGVDFSKKQLFNDRNRIRLICNSIKHNDSYPKTELKKYYPELKLNEKLNLKHLNFKNDIKMILAYVKYFNVIVFSKLLDSKLDLIKDKSMDQISKETKKFISLITEDKSYKSSEFENNYLNK